MFTPLTLQDMELIVQKLVDQLAKRLKEQEIGLKITDAAKVWIAKQGYEPQFGARPLQRFVTKTVETPLAKLLVAGDISSGDTVEIDTDNNELIFKH